MKVGIVYWSSSGNTEQMAEKAKEILESKGTEVIFSEVDSVNKDDFFSSDAFLIGGPAQGSEEIADDMLTFSNEIEKEIDGKKVILFGSFGWGDGEYMEEWQDLLKSKGAIIASKPVVFLESPDDEAFQNMENAINEL